jgi:hypothetical protein
MSNLPDGFNCRSNTIMAAIQQTQQTSQISSRSPVVFYALCAPMWFPRHFSKIALKIIVDDDNMPGIQLQPSHLATN